MSYKFPTKRFQFSSALALALAVGGATTQIRADDDAKEKRLRVIVSTEDDAVEEHVVSKLWLGILLKDIEGDLAAYLGTDEGVLVESVFPESPADVAGLKKGDILLRVGADELAGPADLLAAMQGLKVEEGGQALTLMLTVQRKGEEMKVELTPVPRPKELVADSEKPQVLLRVGDDENQADGAKQAFSFSFSGDFPNEEMEVLLEKLNKGNVVNDVQLFRLGAPSMLFVPAEAESKGEMTVVIKKEVDGENIEVTVTRTDDKPAKITVKTGDDTQEFSEDKLQDMPEHVRSIVEPVLKNKAARINLNNLKFLHEFKSNWSAEETKQMAEKYQKAVADMAEKAKASAESMRAQTLEVAKEARERASAARAQIKAQSQSAGEVDELKKLVEGLRAEVEQLRKQLDKPE